MGYNYTALSMHIHRQVLSTKKTEKSFKFNNLKINYILFFQIPNEIYEQTELVFLLTFSWFCLVQSIFTTKFHQKKIEKPLKLKG